MRLVAVFCLVTWTAAAQSLAFDQQGPPVLAAVNPVVNGGSFTPGFASGEWVSIFGENLAPDTRMWALPDFVGNNLPTSLDGVSVSIDGIPAYVGYISPGQINVLAPDDPALGVVSVQVTSSGAASQGVPVNKQVVAPAFFVVPGSNDIVAAHADNTPVGLSSPARSGEEIVLYGTGFGPTNPPVPTGQLVGAPVPLANAVYVTIGGVPATVDAASLTESGLDQINVVVPAGFPAGDQLVEASVSGALTQPIATIAVE